MWLLLGAGLATSAIVDGYFLYEGAIGAVPDTTLMAALWPASALLCGCAAWVKPTQAEVRLDGLRALAMPALFALAALSVLAYQAVEPLHPLSLALAVATLATVIVRLALTFRENVLLLDRSRREALTDTLTGLSNRRRLMQDLALAAREASEAHPRMLMLFDLDGFKQYNDRFGHPLGDALLARLGKSLAAAVAPVGRAYRLGGDEFCAIAAGRESDLIALAERAREALSEQGQGFAIGSSYGTVLLPEEAGDVSLALHLADERLYANKGGSRREVVTRQTSDALLQVLEECQPGLGGHVHEVAELSRALGERLGLSEPELDDLTRAAELHDIGKVAVPDGILSKPGPLDEAEWSFVRQHTLVGDRILSAAPAMAGVGKLVRASHERYDGVGYPDGSSGEEIPLGARVVAVCDAYHAMTSDRPYQAAVGRREALEELRRCAGHQFDPAVVDAFCELVTREQRFQAAAPARLLFHPEPPRGSQPHPSPAGA